MGGGASSEIGRVAEHIYPIWYNKNAEVSVADEKILKSTWDSILDGTAKGYVSYKGGREDCPSSLAYFYDQFYQRLFEVHPASKELFKNSMVVQGKALVQMISAAISLVKKDPVALKGALTGLAKGHAHKGVLSTQYATVGEVLLWTLEKCLGNEDWPSSSTSWLNCYCVLIKVIIPAAIEEERAMKAGKSTSDDNNKDKELSSSSSRSFLFSRSS